MKVNELSFFLGFTGFVYFSLYFIYMFIFCFAAVVLPNKDAVINTGCCIIIIIYNNVCCPNRASFENNRRFHTDPKPCSSKLHVDAIFVSKLCKIFHKFC